MTNHEDNERHFQHWLDKNSWRRDLDKIRERYETGPPSSPTPYWTPGLQGPNCTDEFHFDAMSVIRYLSEALKYRPHAVPCPQCNAPVRTREADITHLCTVCAELAS